MEEMVEGLSPEESLTVEEVTCEADGEDTPREVGDEEAAPEVDQVSELAAEVAALQEIYPQLEVSRMMEDPTLKALVSGEIKPTLRQAFEMLCPQVLVEAQVQARVGECLSAAVETAVSEAVAMAEKNLLSHIQARGMRPCESGTNAASGVRTHPAVHRLTREDRARLAQMAQLGENVRL